MSKLTKKPPGQSNQPTPVCRPVPVDGRQEAISLLLTGQRRRRDPATPRLLRQVMGQDVPLDQLWAAYDGDTPVVAGLIVPSPGRAAMYFMSPIRDDWQVRPAAALAQQVSAQQDAGSIRLIQGLLDPSQQREAQALCQGGYNRLADLRYMQRSLAAKPPVVALDDTFELVTFTQDNRARFVAAIRASYEQTLDCPGLIGVRDLDDVMAGHQGAGVFVPDLWFVLLHEGTEVAVMLLNEVAQGHAVELVYLGIASGWRRRGIGRRLLSLGLSKAKARGAWEVILAVDESNFPALRLYRSMGFVSRIRKSAMIKALPDPHAG